MAPRNLHAQPIYLEPEKAELLDKLARESRIPKAVLLREAVTDLLVKHRVQAPEAIGVTGPNVIWSDEKRLNELARQAGCKSFAELQERVEFEQSVAMTRRARQKKSKTK